MRFIKESINVHKYKKINENKTWYKTIPNILSWLELKSNMPWVWIDTETTGLGGHKVQQLTQIASIITNYDFKSNTFINVSTFDEKIKLTNEIKSRYSSPDDTSRRILSFNHYGTGNYKYKNEKNVVDSFFSFIDEHSPCFLIAQNAGFDMNMLSGRYGNKISNEVFDTKSLIQLYYLPLLQVLAENDSKYQDILNKIGRSERDGGLFSSSMSKIGPALGINMVGYHDALTDCKITIQMYQKIVDFLKKHQNKDIMKYQSERIKVIRKE